MRGRAASHARAASLTAPAPQEGSGGRAVRGVRRAADDAVHVEVHADRVEQDRDGAVLEHRDAQQRLVLGAHRDHLPARRAGRVPRLDLGVEQRGVARRRAVVLATAAAPWRGRRTAARTRAVLAGVLPSTMSVELAGPPSCCDHLRTRADLQPRAQPPLFVEHATSCCADGELDKPPRKVKSAAAVKTPAAAAEEGRGSSRASPRHDAAALRLLGLVAERVRGEAGVARARRAVVDGDPRPPRPAPGCGSRARRVRMRSPRRVLFASSSRSPRSPRPSPRRRRRRRRRRGAPRGARAARRPPRRPPRRPRRRAVRRRAGGPLLARYRRRVVGAHRRNGALRLRAVGEARDAEQREQVSEALSTSMKRRFLLKTSKRKSASAAVE